MHCGIGEVKQHQMRCGISFTRVRIDVYDPPKIISEVTSVISKALTKASEGLLWQVDQSKLNSDNKTMLYFCHDVPSDVLHEARKALAVLVKE